MTPASITPSDVFPHRMPRSVRGFLAGFIAFVALLAGMALLHIAQGNEAPANQPKLILMSKVIAFPAVVTIRSAHAHISHELGSLGPVQPG